MDNKVLVVASAGGHLTQAMCAVDQCENITLVSNKVNLFEAKIKKTYKIRDTQHNPFIHFFNIFFVIYVLLKERPRAVLSTGGPIVLPFALLCKFLPIRFVFLDTLSRVVELSNTGKLIKRYGLYDKFYCQWPLVAKKNKVEYIGKCFDILGDNEVHAKVKTLADGVKPLILVTLGTNDYPFSRAIESVETMALYKDERVEWVIQSGGGKVKALPANGKTISMVSREEMDGYVKRASLVVSHCGIGSINQMLRYKKEVIFLPRVKKFGEFSDDHQLQIAAQLKNPRFTIVNPQDAFPDLSYEDIKAFGLIDSPVDIINHSLSAKISKILFN